MGLKFVGVAVLLQIVTSSNALYEGCDHTYTLTANSVSYVQSPYYPDKYPSGSSCRYRFIAPTDYEILAECTLAIDKGTSACTTEHFYISREGDPNLTMSDQFCGSGSTTKSSLFRNLVIAYVSTSATYSGVGGAFSCKLTTRPQACDCGWSQSVRIVGGEDATIHEFPSMVALWHKPSATVFCGGTIINHRTIVTAAHCTRLYPNPSDILVIAGDHTLSSSTDSRYMTTYGVSRVVENSQYDSTNNANDIALLFTDRDIEYSRGVGPICLPMDQTQNTFDYTTVDLVGWGTTSFAGRRADTLQKAVVNVLPNANCKSVYSTLQPSQICTYYPGRDSCQFDSGGPVTYKGTRQYLLGIISFGNVCGNTAGANTRVTSFVNWVRSNAVGSLCYKPFS